MKLMATVKWTAVLVLAASLTAYAQGPSSGTGSDSGQGGAGGQHKSQTPEQVAKHLMEKFDANKDSELSVDELTKAVENMQEHRPKGSDNNEQLSADKVAAKMIEKFSSDKKGLKEAELTKAIEERRANHGKQGGEQNGGENGKSPTSN